MEFKTELIFRLLVALFLFSVAVLFLVFIRVAVATQVLHRAVFDALVRVLLLRVARLAQLVQSEIVLSTAVDGGERCVCELMSKLSATQSRMSRHMATLKTAGLVIDRRDAQWVRYRLNPTMPASVHDIVAAAVAASAPLVRTTTTAACEQ